MTQINAYLNFEGNCREVMTFYKKCIRGQLKMQTIEGSPIEDQCPAAIKDQILHASLMKDDLILMGSDMQEPGGNFIQGNNISLSLNCSSEEEIKIFFSKLSEGGKISHALTEQFWGATFGTFTDKFGIRWMLTYDKSR